MTRPTGPRRGDLEHLWELRWRARTDLLWLCRNVLSYDKVDEKVHGPVINFIQQFPVPTLEVARASDLIQDNGTFRYIPYHDPYVSLEGPRRKLILDSRSWFKTTINTVAHTIQWLVNYPQIAMTLLFSTDGKAQDIIKNELKRHFQYNAKLRELFPDFCPQRRIADWGNSESFILPNRDLVLNALKLPPRKEATVSSQSLDKSATGYHYDIIKCSDIEEAQNVLTPQQREQVKYRVGLLSKLLVKRPDSCDGWIDIEGTFYHADGLHATMVKAWREQEPVDRRWAIFIRGVFARETGAAEPKYDPNEMLLPFKKDVDGKRISNWPSADPVHKLEAEEKDPNEGGYVFACTPGRAPVLMSDWSEKPIKDVEIGDEVIGFSPMPEPRIKGNRRRLLRSKVIAKGSHEAEVWEIEMSSGNKIYSTEDHLWFTGRTLDKGHHSPYIEAKVGRTFIKVYTLPTKASSVTEIKAWAYLSGIIDGEGHIDTHLHGANVTISQTNGKNAPVCRKIEETLKTLNIVYNVHRRKPREGWDQMYMYWLKGGRSLKIRMLTNMDFGKKPQLQAHLWNLAGMLSEGRIKSRESVTSMKPVGKQRVYWLQTTTGNYVSQGYASKNCQRILDMSADTGTQRPFNGPLTWITREDFRKVPIAFHFTTVDLADTIGPKSNPSVITTAGYDRAGRCYVHDIQRGKWGPDEIIKRIFDTYQKFRSGSVVLEDYAFVHGLRSSISRYSEENKIFPPFQFEPADRTKSKVARIIHALQPPFKSGEMRFVDQISDQGVVQPDGIYAKFIRQTLENEFSECSVYSTGSSDDILDTLANQFLCRAWMGKNNLGGAHTITKEAREQLEFEQYTAARKKMFFGEDSAAGPDAVTRLTGW